MKMKQMKFSKPRCHLKGCKNSHERKSQQEERTILCTCGFGLLTLSNPIVMQNDQGHEEQWRQGVSCGFYWP
jgi:hypothetical protein